MIILLVIMHLKQMQNIHPLLVIALVFAEAFVTFCSDYSDNLLSDYLSFSLKVNFQNLSSKIMSDIWSVLQASKNGIDNLGQIKKENDWN